MEFKYNSFWYKKQQPIVSIITPVYNRRVELPRALASVRKQTFFDFEHIIIDDGSEESIDDIMLEYMVQSVYPVAFIKKNNGGVHTARNAGIGISRGMYIMPLDSDDELKDDCLEVLVNAWESIPSESIPEYWEVTAFCETQYGKRIGGHLPEGINLLPFAKARVCAKAVEDGEKIGMLRADLLRDNPWPEPEGVRFVSEDIIWMQLRSVYKTWYIDNVVRVYHMETDVSLCNVGDKRSNQQLINMFYNNLWLINNGGKYGQSVWRKLRLLLWYCIFWHLLHWKKEYPEYPWVKDGIYSGKGQLLASILWLPSIGPALIYHYKHK